MAGVTLVSLAAPSVFTVTGSPITSSGTLTLGWSSTGKVPVANLGFGTPTPSTFLAGDGTWKTVPATIGTVTAVRLNVPPPFTLTGMSSPDPSGVVSWTMNWDPNGKILPAYLGTGSPSNLTFLRGDGTWAVPSGSGTGTVTRVGLNLPNAFTITNSPITSSGDLTAIWGSGYIPVANLGTGTPTNTTYLRGDGAWSAIPTPTLDYVLTQGNTTTRSASFGIGSTVAMYQATVSVAPTLPSSVVRLVDLQNVQKGLTFKLPVRAVANVSIGASYNNTNFQISGTGALPLIDGIALNQGDRVLLINQGLLTNAAVGVSNGAYDVTSNTGGTFVLTRSADSQVLSYGDYYFVSAGTMYANSSYVNNTSGTIVVGTTAISYTQFSASAQAGSATPLAIGVATPGVSTNFSRQDHVHPFSLTTTGTGGTATYNNVTGVLNIPASTVGTVTSVASSSTATALTLVTTNPNSTPAIALAWSSAQVPLANLATGTPDNTKFLRGDGTWAVPTGTASGSVTSVSSALTALTFTNPTTTPALTLVGGSATTYLDGTGKWSVPQGVYSGTVTAVNVGAITNLPITMSIATSTTTPTISLSAQSYNAITPPSPLQSYLIGATSGSSSPGAGTYLAGTAGQYAQWTAFPTIVSDVQFTTSSNDAGNAFQITSTGSNVKIISFKNVPAGASTSTFLRGDGTWTVPSGTGGTVTMVSTINNASGLTLSVVSPSLTPVFTLAWNNSGFVPTLNLGSGTADGTRYLAGDQTWKILPNPGAGTLTNLTISSVAPLASEVINPTTTPQIRLTWGSGQIPPANLGTGTANFTKYLAGDGSWTTFPTLNAGTVTNVGVGSVASAFNLTVALNTTTPQISLGWGGGLVPTGNLASSGTPSATTFLRGDGTWATPSGTSIGTITRVALAVPSPLTISGSPVTTGDANLSIAWGTGVVPVANLGVGTTDSTTYLRGDGAWTTFPTLKQGTVTSVNLVPGHTAFSFSGGPITSMGNITLGWGSGLVPTANLGSGTANSTTYLRGDQTWATIPASSGGTVTNVNFTAPSPLQITGAPITTSGTLALTWMPNAQIPLANLGSGTPTAGTYVDGASGAWTAISSVALTSVGLTLPNTFVVSNSPLTSNGAIGVAWGGSGKVPVGNLGTGVPSNTTYLRGDGSWAAVTSGGGGSVTLVGLESGSTAFMITNTPITSTGNIAINWGSGLVPAANLGSNPASASVFLRGDQTWTTVPAPALNQVLAAGNTSALGASLGSLAVSATPSGSTDVVRLVDLQQIPVLNYRQPVKYLATNSIGSTYINGAGIGSSTISGSGSLIIDGVTLTSGDVGSRVLLVGQGALGTTPAGASNGPYTVTTVSGSGFTLTRTTDTIAYGNYYFVSAGNTEDATSWINNTTGTVTIGTTPLSYVQFFAAPDAATSAPQPIGTATIGTSSRYAREDHVHPFTLTTAGASGAATYSNGVLNIPTVPGGTVTSVSLAVPQPLKVTSSSLTTNPTFTIDWDINRSSYIPTYALGGGNPNSNYYLRGDSLWVPFPTLNTGTVTNFTVSATAPIIASVTNPTTTPALSIGFTTGQIPTSNLGTGTPSSTTYLRGDGSWATFPTISGGTVTSVGVTATAPLTITGTSTITTSGTFNIGFGSGQIPAANLGTGTANSSAYLRGDGVWATFPSISAGTVTTVSASVPAPLAVSVTNPTSAPAIALTWSSGQIPVANLGSGSATSAKYLAGDGTWTTFPTLNAGTVTSASLSMPNPFSVVSSNITTTPTFTVSWGSGQIPTNNLGAGTPTAAKYLTGDGIWTTFPTLNAGTVTSVAATATAPILVAVTNASTTPSIAISFTSGQIPVANLGAGTSGAGKYLAGDGNWTTFPTLNAGTVTSVSATGVAPLTLTVASPSSTPSITASWGAGQIPVANLGTGLADSTKYLAGDGSWTTLPSAGSGTVTSINLTMPSAFSVSPVNPITSSGTFAVTWASGQFVPTASLGSGTASGIKFLAGDQTWKNGVLSVSTTIAGFAISGSASGTPSLGIASGVTSGYLDYTGNFSTPSGGGADPLPLILALG